MAKGTFMDEVQAYYQDTSGRYPEIKAQIKNDRDTMLTERAAEDSSRLAYQEEERKLESARRRREHLKESINAQNERRREVKRSSSYSDETKKESLDSIAADIKRLEKELEEEEEEIERIKNARDQYIYDEDVHRQAADAAQKSLKKAVKDCGKLAKSLAMHAEVAKFEADKNSGVANTFGSISSSIRYAKGESHNAQAQLDSVSSKYGTLAGQLSSLADKYAQLAQTDTGGPSGGSSKAGAGKGQAAQRAKQVAMAATAAAVMVTGAAFHATRPASTFEPGMSSSDIVQERIVNIQDALTGPDQIVDDEKKRKENEKHMKRMSREPAPWF